MGKTSSGTPTSEGAGYAERAYSISSDLKPRKRLLPKRVSEIRSRNVSAARLPGGTYEHYLVVATR